MGGIQELMYGLELAYTAIPELVWFGVAAIGLGYAWEKIGWLWSE